MLIPVLSAKDWAELYGIPLEPAKCLRCGGVQNFTTPFAYGGWRGLISDHSQCGEEFRQYIFSSSNPEERQKIGEALKVFCTSMESK